MKVFPFGTVAWALEVLYKNLCIPKNVFELAAENTEAGLPSLAVCWVALFQHCSWVRLRPFTLTHLGPLARGEDAVGHESVGQIEANWLKSEFDHWPH